MALLHSWITSKGNRHRFSTDPPYSSVLLLTLSCRNWSSKYPFAPWISMPSKPASMADLDAAPQLLVISWISSGVKGRGGCSSQETPSIHLPDMGISLELTVCCPPRKDGGEARPVCQS